ncbi:hypothetical protein Esti_002397 [Eimeria stiedai]
MKAIGPAVSPAPSVPSEDLERQMGEAKQANVPVVVLGATVGGLAAAVAIRSRTGRAVCVIDIDGRETGAEMEGEKEKVSVLSARSLDALRAINAELHKTILSSAKGECSSPTSTTCGFDTPLRLSSPILREALIDHLTAGAGGASSIWRSSALKGITLLARGETDEAAEASHEVAVVFDNGVVIRAGLVVVAMENFPFLAHTKDPMCVEGVATLPEGATDGLWLVRGDSDSESPEVALISETQKQAVTFIASSPSSARTQCPDSPRQECVAVVGKKMETLQDDNNCEPNAALLSAVLEKIKKTPAIFRSHSILKTPDSSWTFWGGSLILTGAAAHPWASALGDALELELEDAAQLGCSLYDWKFALRLASDRFETIRKRRLSSFPSSPRTAVSPESTFVDEDQMFVPTRDAYAALLPAVGLGYEVQEVELF